MAPQLPGRSRWLQPTFTRGTSTSTIKIEFDPDNAAFAGEDLGPGIADALDHLAGRIREQNRSYLAQPGQSFVVRDVNGNSIGKATFEAIEEDWEDAEDYISRVPRAYVVELLEGISIQCYDTEGVDFLREELLLCVKDGDLTLEQVRSHCGGRE